MRTSYDKGHGSDLGSFFSIHLGPGSGYLRRWWTSRNRGPGKATFPHTQDCGHRGIDHCNSIHCRRTWCRFPETLLGRWLLRGRTVRIWTGPTYNRRKPQAWLSNARLLWRRRRHAGPSNRYLYSFASFR